MTQKGEPCVAPAQRGRKFCFRHDPAQEAARAEASSSGGRVRAAQMDKRPLRAEVDRLPALINAGAAKQVIEKTIRWVLIGELDPRAANAVATCIRAFADLHRDEDVERQLRELEAQIGAPLPAAMNGHAVS